MRPLQRRVENRMVALLKEQVDIFTWLHQGTPGWNTHVVGHELPSREDYPLVKKKAGATDQRATVTLFHDMTHRESECHVDDMMTKSQVEEGHPVDLIKLFDRSG